MRLLVRVRGKPNPGGGGDTWEPRASLSHTDALAQFEREAGGLT